MAARSTSTINPSHLVVNMLRLLDVIEKAPVAINSNSLQRLREQIDALHRMKLIVALPDALDLDNVDRRVDAIIEAGRRAQLAQHLPKDLESSSVELPSRSLNQALSSSTPEAASLVPDHVEDDMRLALLTPKGAPSRKKINIKADKNNANVSMQVLRIENIAKMNKQVKNGMQDILNTAKKVCCWVLLHLQELNLMVFIFSNPPLHRC
jgi:hypothetical protein